MKKTKQNRKELMETLRSLKGEELNMRIRDESEQLFWLRYKRDSKQLENASSLRQAKRNVARLLTLKRQEELKVQKGAAR